MSARDATFVIHHVGARQGSFPFPAPAELMRDIHVVLYDADADCIAGVEAMFSDPQRRVLPLCLDAEERQAEFRLTLNGSASSLLEPSERQRPFYMPLWGIDWDVRDCAEVVTRQTLKTTALDKVVADGAAAAPDFLSLDTQGSELAILRGAGKSLGRIIGVVSEVQFLELYEQVPRFSDISTFLEERGFYFVGFTNLIKGNARQVPIGQRANGFVIAGDGLWLRNIDSVPDTLERNTMLERLAFASLAFGHIDYMLAALRARKGASEPGPRDAGWRRALARLDVAAGDPGLSPPVFPHLLRKGALNAFNAEPDPQNWTQYFDLKTWFDEASLKVDVQATLEAAFLNRDSPIESELRALGFPDAADEVSFCRRDQSWKVAQLLHQAGLWLGTPGA
ncbi:MAG: FkbM family methyltransferase [Alphaproteobacteria bacterium]|nr:FkbM family methyltransferase [Alphaproteobacteria bacterium]MDZ4762515.1 FkbM family methyltransferase [Alphaproteobacteria bacterium]